MKQLAAWYQKKISSYDKEEWETMVEQLLMRGTYRRRIVDFSAGARSYLIDVDLVRGSSFPKAKPVVGARRVVWFALGRLLWLPALRAWWARHTSPACARLLLALWLLQALNVALYCAAPSNLDLDAGCWAVPLLLMVSLSVVHAHIVSTTELELARLRPRHTVRRKLPPYLRRSARSEGSAGDSAASSTQSKGSKPAKFRRRPTREQLDTNGLRKRKKELTKENVTKNLEAPVNKPRTKVTKAKDSDDDDYMCWKKPEERNNPTVTVTAPETPRYKPNILTKKHLESFNVRISRQINIARVFADGDDGFESLNGNDNSNDDFEARNNVEPQTVKVAEDVAGEHSTLESEVQRKTEREEENKKEREDERKTEMDRDSYIKKEEVKNIERDQTNTVPREEVSKIEKDEVKKIETEEESKIIREEDNDRSESEGPAPTSSPGSGKRAGVRFRGKWAHDDSSDEVFDDVKKKKKASWQWSSSDGSCSAAASIALPSHHTLSDWAGHSSNSEESSYGSQSEGAPPDVGFHCAADSSWDPFAILDPASDTVKCTMWERGSTLRAELSAVDISWYVVARAERALAAGGAHWAAPPLAAAAALTPPALRLLQVCIEQDGRTEDEIQALSTAAYVASAVSNYWQGSAARLAAAAFGDNVWEVSTSVLSCVLRFALAGVVFFLLSVAERAYKQRFLYAKLFSHLTSARRARKSELPHFRLSTVRNIKTWLSTRSYLRRRGPQRSVDVIVSAAFMLTITLLACVSAQLLRESLTLECLWVLEAMVWALSLGLYLLRLITLGSDVNRKYRGCLSAIITEQINLHLAMEQRPQCKERLQVANNVLKLAADLLKELDAPFKISGIWGNHYMYTVTKVVILSALSGVLSDMLGFKLKLHKIKIK